MSHIPGMKDSQVPPPCLCHVTSSASNALLCLNLQRENFYSSPKTLISNLLLQKPSRRFRAMADLLPLASFVPCTSMTHGSRWLRKRKQERGGLIVLSNGKVQVAELALETTETKG